jgi:hypothetical protein
LRFLPFFVLQIFAGTQLATVLSFVVRCSFALFALAFALSPFFVLQIFAGAQLATVLSFVVRRSYRCLAFCTCLRFRSFCAADFCRYTDSLASSSQSGAHFSSTSQHGIRTVLLFTCAVFLLHCIITFCLRFSLVHVALQPCARLHLV